MNYEDLSPEDKERLERGFEDYKKRGKTNKDIAITLDMMSGGDPDNPLDFAEYFDYYDWCSGPQMCRDDFIDLEFYRYFPCISELHFETKRPVDLATIGVMPELYWAYITAPISSLPFLGPNLRMLMVDQPKEFDPSNIPKHNELTTLMLLNHFVQDYSFLGGMDQLEDLTLSGGGLESLDQLPPLPNLKTLSVSHNHLTSLEGIDKFSLLENVWACGNKITAVEPLLALRKLQSLDISYNPLKDWHRIGALTSLTMFNGEGLGLTDLEFIRSLTDLKQLHLKHNNVSKFGHYPELTKCEKVNLSYNNLTSLDGFGSLPALEHLEVNYNRIETIDHLTETLRQLKVEGNQLATLVRSKPEIHKSLKFLYAHNNHLRDLAGVEAFPNLVLMYCDQNSIDSIDAITENKKLSWLSASNNRISDISALSNLTSLDNLDLKHNRIYSLKPLKNTKKFFYINIDGNPLGTGFRKSSANCPLDAASEAVRELCRAQEPIGCEGPIA